MYDITIVGAGVSGIFLAHTLIKSNENLKILLLEKGEKFQNRICHIETGASDVCIHCKVCSRTQGFGGMGRSEGKYNYSNDFGGKLGDKIGADNAIEMMNEVDKVLCSFGADKVKLYNTKNTMLTDLAKENNCRILSADVRHLGTKLSSDILMKMYVFLNSHIEIEFNTDISSINKADDLFHVKSKGNTYISKKLVLATGISGKESFINYCKTFHIEAKQVRVDLGIRVEMDNSQLDHLLNKTFEIKLAYQCDDYQAMTYCMNPKGKIIKKYQDGFIMADGQNQYETHDNSFNLNFTVFVPQYFKSTKEANIYIQSILGKINGHQERIIIQRLEDLINKTSTSNSKLLDNSITPTLKSSPGELREYVPEIYIRALLKILDLLKILTNKVIHQDTLLYGLDAKFYQPEIETNIYFESKEKNLYVIGDCSGTTYSLSQAAASGIYLARNILS